MEETGDIFDGIVLGGVEDGFFPVQFVEVVNDLWLHSFSFDGTNHN